MKIDRRIAIITTLAITVMLLAAYLLWPSGEEDDGTLAERAALSFGDLEGRGWSFGEGSDSYPDNDNCSSHYQIWLFTTAEPGFIRVLLVTKAYGSAEICDAEYHADRLEFADDDRTELPDAGDEGFISWHDSGNGSCALCFRQDSMMVWMDVITNYGGNPAWEDDEIYQEVSVLIDAQSRKISSLLDQ